MRVRLIAAGIVFVTFMAACSGSAEQQDTSVATTSSPATTLAATTTTPSTTTTIAVTTSVATTTTAPVSQPVAGWANLPAHTAGFGEVTLTGGAAGSGVYVLAGCARDAGTASGGASAPSPLWWSADGATWERAHGDGEIRCVGQVASTPFGFVAVGSGQQLWSADGMEWETLELHDDFGLEFPGQLGNAQAVFVSPAGDRVTLLYSRAAEAESTIASLVTTTDGEDWSLGPQDVAAQFDSSGIADVIAGGDGLLAVGSSPGGEFVPTAAVFTSSDGLDWRRVTPSNSDFDDKVMTAVAAITGGYVAVGGDFFTTGLMTAWTSPDGISWTRAPHPNETTDPSVAFMTAEAITVGEGQMWAAGRDFDARRGDDQGMPAMWTSTDGRAWTRIDFPDDTGLVPFVILDTTDLTLAAWPPPLSLASAPVQLFTPEP